MTFKGDLIVMQLEPRKWRVYESFTYWIGGLDSREYVHIGKGMETDFASIPRPLWALWPPSDGAHSRPAVVHDCLYKTGFVCVDDGSVRWITRQEADAIFLDAMKVNGVRWISRRLIHRGVRLGGRAAWAKHRKAQGHDVGVETVD